MEHNERRVKTRTAVPRRLAAREKINDMIFIADHSAGEQLLGVALWLATLAIWQAKGCGRISLGCFMAGAICLGWSTLTMARAGNRDGHYRANTALLAVLESLSLLYLGGNHADITAEIGIFREYILVFGLAAVLAVQMLWLALGGPWRRPGRAAVARGLVLAALCLIFAFVLNLECFNTWVRWDAYHYFRAFDLMQPQAVFVKDGLKPCNHSAISYSIWSLLFCTIPGLETWNALYLSNMALIAIDLVLLFLLFRRLLPKDSWVCSLLFSLVVVCSPWIMGSVADFSGEHILMTGVLLLLYAIFDGNYMLSALAVFIVCNARETGAIIAAMLIFTQLVCAAASRKKEKRPVNALALEYYALCLCLGLLWLLQFLMGNWMEGMLARGNDAYFLDGPVILHFGFSTYHLKAVLISSLLANFNWIFAALVLVSAVVWLAGRKRPRRNVAFLAHKEYGFIWVGFLTYLVVLTVYLSGHLYRYYTTQSVLLCILGLCGLRYLLGVIRLRPLLRHAATVLLAGLVLAQSYRYIDPLSRALLPTIDTGESVLVPLPQYISTEVENSFTDMAYGNRQIMYFEKALDKAYAAIYEESAPAATKVLISNEYWARVVDGNHQLGSFFITWGFGYRYLEPPMWGAWNAEGQYRYLSYEPDVIIDPDCVLVGTDLSERLDTYEGVYYIEMPWGDTVIGPLQEKYPTTRLFTTIRYMGWVLNIYKIQ